MKKNVKFDQYLDDKIVYNDQTKSKGRHGIVMGYDKYNNTAIVLLSSPDSDQTGDLVSGVMCPVYPGIQMMAPEPGRPCWVVFTGDRGEKMPVITHYFNHKYAKYDYTRQYESDNGISSFRMMM